MKFVLLIYQGTSMERLQTLSPEEQKKVYADYAELNATPGVTPGLPLGLPQAAKTVQIRDGKALVQNGTYLSEGVGGYLVCEVENLEAAIEIAKRIPAARLGGSIEIRPAEKYW